MGMVQMDPTAETRPHLPTAGQYGSGLNGFEVELTRFEHPAKERMPAFDRDGERGPYAYFGFQCKSEDQGIVFYDHWEPIGPGTGSREAKWLRNIGVEVNEQLQFDDADVAGRSVIIEVKDPRKADDGRIFNGNLVNVIGA